MLSHQWHFQRKNSGVIAAPEGAGQLFGHQSVHVTHMSSCGTMLLGAVI